MMSARRFLNLVHGVLLEHLDEDGRAHLENAMADESVRASQRIDLLLGAGGEVVMPT